MAGSECRNNEEQVMKKITNIILIGMVCLSVVAKPSQPNILLILADDLGYADLSIHGCTEFKTPNIDSIAKGGVRFKQGYVCNSVCAPSRAGILTGRTGIGFEGNADAAYGLDLSLETMADTMKRAGYATSCIGKWHLGAQDTHYPTQRGFDWFCGLREGSRTYFYDESNSDSPDNPHGIELNGKQIKFEGYLTDFLTDQAIGVIDRHTRATPEKPFFMYLSYTAPHGPNQCKPGTDDNFKDLKGEKRPTYAAMVVSLDEGVGRVLQTLEEKGLSENTLIVFLSDNGGPTYKNGSSNWPLKGKKGSTDEGGLRVPFLLQWQEKIPAGQIRDDMVISLDLLPTFAAVAGVEPPEKMSGLDLMPYLADPNNQLADRGFYWRRAGMKNCAFRTGDYKWIENRNKDEQYLYNLKDDISEKNNLIATFPEVAERMRLEYVKWESTIPDPPPVESSSEQKNNKRGGKK